MVGLFGVLAWDVVRGTPEIGIRMALGASRSVVRWHVLRRGLVLVAAGTACGLVVTAATLWPLRGFLLGSGPADPLMIGSVIGVLLLTGAIASLIPAHRASSIDPAVAMRRC